MGRVWLARDELLRRDVAVKEIALPFGLSDDEHREMRDRTLREARAAARLNHPNVVRIYDVQPGDERPWIVMEFVRSHSLHQVIHEKGPLPVNLVAGDRPCDPVRPGCCESCRRPPPGHQAEQRIDRR
jgi:serine/threonine protein kinase